MRTEKREKVKEREDLRVLSLKRVKERQTNIVSHGQGRSQNLKLGGAALLLIVYSDFDFRLRCYLVT